MKITLPIASACVISLLLGFCNCAEAGLSTENLQQAAEENNDAVPSVAQLQASLQRDPNNSRLYSNWDKRTGIMAITSQPSMPSGKL